MSYSLHHFIASSSIGNELRYLSNFSGNYFFITTSIKSELSDSKWLCILQNLLFEIWSFSFSQNSWFLGWSDLNVAFIVTCSGSTAKRVSFLRSSYQAAGSAASRSLISWPYTLVRWRDTSLFRHSTSFSFWLAVEPVYKNRWKRRWAFFCCFEIWKSEIFKR